MVALPYNTVYKLGANTKVNNLLSKEEYLEETYHTFDYPSAISSSTDKAKSIQDWYIKYCSGKYENYTEEEQIFVIEYAGARFKVDFIKNKEGKKLRFF